MIEERLARLERKINEADSEWAALEHAMAALSLEICTADETAIDRIHSVLMAFAFVERLPGGEKAERRATAVEMLADRLLLATRRNPRQGQGRDGAQ